jgi:uncharacterized membrane protein (DUF485 family)
MNNNLNVTNIHFNSLISKISAVVPSSTIIFILLTYIVMAAINAYFLPLPIILSVLSALILALGRFLIVFTDFLLFTSKNNLWQKVLAGFLTLVALVELWVTLGSSYADYRLAIFLNIGGIIVLGLALELSFLEKAKLSISEAGQKSGGDEKLNNSTTNFQTKKVVM